MNKPLEKIVSPIGFALVFSFCLILAFPLTSVAAETKDNPSNTLADKAKALKDTQFLGIKLADANLDSVRKQLWDIGGFLQAKSTIRQRNIDKFYPWSTLRDSYYITFRYNNAGNLTSVKRLYRPYGEKGSHKNRAIATREVALKLMTDLGQPNNIERKNSDGGMSYLSYTWQDKDMKITIDREGSNILGNVFVEYTLKNNNPYEVI
ncbi:hypothetical protein JCM30760_13540 [Thiomicrorhabdus hydrogeniphila]